ncbi:ribosome hibernation-promoting factor, HPF/YfiA family [Capnocytophaga sp. ARDL2]|uniref:ribosome hibernation-promoting factor, HPF/YfiA family n=1 Tax=Capnocytophaga sp. ARDL2 TaxID=3238809 RepID=UPI0035567E11
MHYLSEYIDYLLKEKKYSLHTARAYYRDVESFWSFIGDEVDVREIDAIFIRRWVAHLSTTDVANKTINRKLSSLKSYFKFLYIVQVVENYPLDLLKNLRVEKKIQIPFSAKEMQEVIDLHFQPTEDYETSRNLLILSLFYHLGLRKSELIQLQMKDYMIDSFRIIGKGTKERRIPISASLQEQISNYLILRKKQKSEGEDYFFLMKNGKKINQTFVYRLINDYFRPITTKEKTSPHILRHSFATHLIENGAEINAVKQLMGHASLSSTQVYVNNSVEELKKIYAQAHPLNRVQSITTNFKNSTDMKINVQAVGFSADRKLVDFLNERLGKLEQYYDKIVGIDVNLHVENTSDKENKQVDVLVKIPGDDLIVKKIAKSFEEAADNCGDALERLLVKRKEKAKGN